MKRFLFLAALAAIGGPAIPAPAGDTVQLVVTPLGSQETRTLEGVRMTTANRNAIRNAAQVRE